MKTPNRLSPIVAAATVAMILATGCGQAASSPANNTSNTVVSGPANNADTANSASNSTNGQDSSGTTTLAVTSSAQAESVVSGIYQKQLSTDPKLKVTTDHTSTEDAHTIYSVHVYDDLSDHTATVAWIDVRDDGMVRDGMTRGSWVPADTYQPQN